MRPTSVAGSDAWCCVRGVRTVAALFVEPKGAYAGHPGVDLWPESRDARLYNLAHPVVAHPPCARWSVLAPLVHSLGGRKPGDDDGTFASALDSVRRVGGVLEHPAQSVAWVAHGLTPPPKGGGWMRAGFDDPGWTCEVAQRNWGHQGRKRTWLYAVGCDLPSLAWGDGSLALVSLSTGESSRRGGQCMGRKERKLTPPAFRDLLIAMARSVES